MYSRDDEIRVPVGGAELPPDSASSDEDDDSDSSTWAFAEGAELAPGYLAWDLLGIGRRFESWISWCQDRMTPVCVKLPRADSLDTATIRALERELQAATAMSHPAIPRVLAADLNARLPYLVYEFIEGRPLSVVLDEDGPFDAHDVVLIGIQLAAALRHVHRRGFVHLDVKPSNVSLRGERAILLDFDISLPIGAQRSKTRPRGTAWYMAPEQIRCEPAHPSMDLFALGALLYEAATAHLLFTADTCDQPSTSDGMPDRFPQLQAPADLSPLTDRLPAPLVEAIGMLLAADPHDRPSDAGQAVEMLEAALPTGTEPLWPPWVTPALLERHHNSSR